MNKSGLKENTMNSICHHVGLFAKKPGELIKFYTEKFGFEEGESKVIPGELVEKIFGLFAPCTLTKLKLGQVTLEIISPDKLNLKERFEDTLGYNHWGLGVGDNEAFSQKLKARGVSLVEIESKGRSIFFAKDPEGNLIEIYTV